MKSVFVGTSGWVAIAHAKDNLHQKAIKIFNELLDKDYCFITTNFILDETYTMLLKRAGHFFAIDFGDKIRKPENAKIIYINKQIEDMAWELFKKCSDKTFSYTDCNSFIVIQNLIENMPDKFERNIFTSDNHFRQMGYGLFLETEKHHQ